ncbi:MAG: triose-phosphate isomerase, partial [Proteobacteria bacterium]|nr:triose-phosphate isomerase [Pseudomonadota bacterium]
MKKLMAANWKMFKIREESRDTATGLADLISGKVPSDREVLLIPPLPSIRSVYTSLGEGARGIEVGAQNFYPAEEGAYTGEVSPRQLKDLGVTYVLTGHSERRHVLGESDELVGQKTAYGLQEGLSVILCIGEKIEERKAGQVEAVLSRQMEAGLKGVPADIAPERIVLAYEPVWAIGTGEVAGPAEITEAHTYTRKKLQEILPGIANEIRILYGGSVKPDNCADIIALDNVNGVLV